MKKWIVAVVMFFSLSITAVAAPGTAVDSTAQQSVSGAAVAPLTTVATGQANAKKSADLSKKILRIGVVVMPPFISKSGQNYIGFVAAIWKNVAEEARLNYQFVNAGDNSQEAIDALASGKYDALIGPITVTATRLKKVHFSRPFYINKLSAVTLGNVQGFWGLIWHMIKAFFAWSLLVYFSFIIVYALYHLVVERPRKTKEFQGNIIKAYCHAFLLIVHSFLTRSYPRESSSILSRLVLILWIIASIIFTSQLVATVTSALTVSHSSLTFEGNVATVSTLYDRKVVAQKDSYAAGVAARLGANVISVDHLYQAFSLLREKTVNMVLANYLTLKYVIQKNPNINYTPSPVIVGANEMAFAFPKGSGLRNKVDEALTHMQDRSVTYGICRTYLGPLDSQACII
jgi:polar amino acid transport system substrate-binding protein